VSHYGATKTQIKLVAKMQQSMEDSKRSSHHPKASDRQKSQREATVGCWVVLQHRGSGDRLESAVCFGGGKVEATGSSGINRRVGIAEAISNAIKPDTH
jgi:hypothetical protein